MKQLLIVAAASAALGAGGHAGWAWYIQHWQAKPAVVSEDPFAGVPFKSWSELWGRHMDCLRAIPADDASRRLRDREVTPALAECLRLYKDGEETLKAAQE
jgi:hypothetical protein